MTCCDVHVVFYCGVMCCVMLYYGVLCYGMLCSIVLCCVVMCCVVLCSGVDADYLLGIVSWVPTVNTVDDYVGWTSKEFQSKFLATFNMDATAVAASAFAGERICLFSYRADMMG